MNEAPLARQELWAAVVAASFLVGRSLSIGEAVKGIGPDSN